MKKLTKKFYAGYYGAFLTLKKNTEDKMNEFQKIKSIKESADNLNLSLAKQVYMESIISDMAKILGVTRSDQTGIESIKKYLQSKKFIQFKKRIEKIDQKYKPIKSKIKQNRNRIINHLDFHKRPYYNFKFSLAEVKRIYDVPSNPNFFTSKDKAQAEKQLISNQKRNQRYEPIDIDNDIPLFSDIIKELKEVFDEIHLLVFNPQRYKVIYNKH